MKLTRVHTAKKPARSFVRSDGKNIWDRLPPIVRDRIGIAAVDMAVAMHTEQHSDDAIIKRAAQASWGVSLTAIEQAAVLVCGTNFAPGAAPIPKVVGAICTECGCTEHDGCEGGCYWTSQSLCSECAPPSIRKSRR